ncbi:MAG: MarC family NAAT transporter [Candidatus Lightella neohaematopini]|nr:MarC family NAAT transporter [Candidatus Lightella neohaematopini]MCV2529027.1 MarC family NAAT transporter [Candidatus Lightella neohaematopini]
MFELIKAIGFGLMILLPLVNPLTTVALFLGLCKNMTLEERNYQARMASIYVFIIMLVAFYAGTSVMNTFGISISGLRIAGGLIISFIGFRMLFPTQNDEYNLSLSDNKVSNIKVSNIAFVPLAMPSTAGPGTIAMIISWVSTVHNNVYFSPWINTVAPALLFITISFIVWIVLRSSSAIMHIIGSNGIEAISRLVGFLLVCMGVQFIINGIVEVINNYHI